MKTRYTQFLLLTLLTYGSCLPSLQAQVGIGTATPDVNAILDVTSTIKGILLPRLTPAQQTTLAATLNNSQRGMMVTDANTGQTHHLDGWATGTTPSGIKLYGQSSHC